MGEGVEIYMCSLTNLWNNIQCDGQICYTESENSDFKMVFCVFSACMYICVGEKACSIMCACVYVYLGVQA